MADPISGVVERGGVVESVHTVHAAVVRDGALVGEAGDPRLVTFMRSAAKPLQALPLALEEPGLPPEELAIACASHEATPEQLALVRALLERAGETEDALACGEEHGSKLGHNCSGKHAGMLLRVRRHGWPREGYERVEHPLQAELLAVVAGAAGVPPAEIPTATDGCGVLTFALPLEAMARAFSRLARGELPGSQPVVAAMLAHPELVGGPKAADTAVMRARPGVLAKRGAEGVLCAALPDGSGVAVKVADGANRAALPALAALLGIQELEETSVFNSLCEQVGRLFPRWKNSGSLFPKAM